MNRLGRKLKGFTLVELIIVIAIIAILGSIIVPNMISSVRDSKIRSANAQAQVVYNATQSVLTSLETRGKKVTDYFPEKGADTSGGSNSISHVQINCTNGVMTVATANVANGDELIKKLRANLGSDFGSVDCSFRVEVYNKTYTVKKALYCEKRYNSACDSAVGSNSDLDSNKITTVFGSTANSQETYAITNSVMKYVGQYPIPVN